MIVQIIGTKASGYRARKPSFFTAHLSGTKSYVVLFKMFENSVFICPNDLVLAIASSCLSWPDPPAFLGAKMYDSFFFFWKKSKRMMVDFIIYFPFLLIWSFFPQPGFENPVLTVVGRLGHFGFLPRYTVGKKVLNHVRFTIQHGSLRSEWSKDIANNVPFGRCRISSAEMRITVPLGAIIWVILSVAFPSKGEESYYFNFGILYTVNCLKDGPVLYLNADCLFTKWSEIWSSWSVGRMEWCLW